MARPGAETLACQSLQVMDTDALWGGKLTRLTLDPVSWSLRAGVEVNLDGMMHRYELVQEGVKDLHAERDVPRPWTYAELSEVHVYEADDGLRVELVLWTDGSGITARCTGAQVLPVQ